MINITRNIKIICIVGVGSMKDAYKKLHIVGRCFHQDTAEPAPKISLLKLKQALKSKNIHFSEGYVCLIADCPMCNVAKHKGSKVYINKTTGFFICEKCRSTGSWNILEKFLEPKKSTDAMKELAMFKEALIPQKDYSHTWKALQKQCENLTDLPMDMLKDIFNKFSLPVVAKEDIHQLSCLYDNTTSTLYFPLTAFSNYIVGYKCLSVNPVKESTVPPSDVSGLIVYKQTGGKMDGSAVIVPTIPDMLALISQKSANVVICLPYDLKHLPQQLLPSTESYKKLILWFGNDEPSWDVAKHFAKKLNEQRCFFVRPIDVQPRPKLAADMGCNLRDIIQNAQPIWHKSITTFNNLREDILSDLQNTDKVQGVKWKRYPALNRILKGHRKGEFTILTGPTGSGKTTFMSEYSLDLAMQGVNTLWGSFEIRNARLARTMLQQMAGVPLDERLEHFDTFADTFEKLPIYFMTFHGQQNIKVVMDAVEHATYVHDIAHVIIDNVQFMMGLSEDTKNMDRYWRQDVIVGAFRQFATKFNCHVTLVIHPRKEKEEELTTSSIFGGAKASQEADNILIIQDKRLTNVRGKKYLQIAKNRYSGDLGIMLLEFDKPSLSYAHKKKPKTENESHKDDAQVITK